MCLFVSFYRQKAMAHTFSKLQGENTTRLTVHHSILITELTVHHHSVRWRLNVKRTP